MSQQIIGLQRVLENKGVGQAWNNKIIRWSIVHNWNNQTKPYDIELEMVLVSSKRIVRVNGQVKDTQMCSFGYESKFDISSRLKGFIKQDSLSFELFVNQQSFTKLQELNKSYEPPKLYLDNSWLVDNKNKQVKKKSDFLTDLKQVQEKDKSCSTQQVLNKITKSFSENKGSDFFIKQMQCQSQATKFQTPQLKQKPLSSQIKQDKKATQNEIKDTQNQLMKILMAEKKRKKIEKKPAQSLG